MVVFAIRVVTVLKCKDYNDNKQLPRREAKGLSRCGPVVSSACPLQNPFILSVRFYSTWQAPRKS